MANSDWVEFEAENSDDEVFRILVKKSAVSAIAISRVNERTTELYLVDAKDPWYILLPYERVCQALGFYK